MTSNEHSSPLVYLPTPAPQTPSLILDVGCGSGLSGDSITSAGHHWIGIDISTSMLSMFTWNVFSYSDSAASIIRRSSSGRDRRWFDAGGYGKAYVIYSHYDDVITKSHYILISCLFSFVSFNIFYSVLRFRPGSFDGAIRSLFLLQYYFYYHFGYWLIKLQLRFFFSVSAVQWLCNADKKSHVPYQRLTTFFKWLYSSLTKGARAVSSPNLWKM